MISRFGNLFTEGLAVGTYPVTIRDSEGCEISTSVTIENSMSEIMADFIVTDVSCFGEMDGAIEIILDDPSNYIIDLGGADPSSLFAGIQIVNITDSEGCSQDFDVFITQPDMITVEVINAAQDLCTGLVNADDVVLEISGGVGPYSVSSFSMPDFLELTIRDSLGCEFVTGVTQMFIPELTITNSVIVNASDSPNSGSVDITAEGGTGMYTYIWTDENGLIVSNRGCVWHSNN